MKIFYFLFTFFTFFLFQPSVLAVTETCQVVAYSCSSSSLTKYIGVNQFEYRDVCPVSYGTYATWNGASSGGQVPKDCGLDSFDSELVSTGNCPLGMTLSNGVCTGGETIYGSIGMYPRPGYSQPYCAEERFITSEKLYIVSGSAVYENGSLVSSTLPDGSNWEIATSSDCVEDDPPPDEEPPPDDTCSGTDCVECANIICECIEGVKTLVQDILNVLREILDALNGLSEPPSEEPTSPPILDKTAVEEAENPLECGYDSLFEKFPFDIMGDLGAASSNTCPAVFLLAREFEICWLLDLVKVMKYPLIIGFLIRILIFL